MENIIYLSMLVLMLLTSAFTTAFIAKKMGRSFWFWLIISFPLCMMSIFILLWLPPKQKPNEEN